MLVATINKHSNIIIRNVIGCPTHIVYNIITLISQGSNHNAFIIPGRSADGLLMTLTINGCKGNPYPYSSHCVKPTMKGTDKQEPFCLVHLGVVYCVTL